MLDSREDVAFEPKVRSQGTVVRRSQRVLTAEGLAERRAEERELGELESVTSASESVPSAPVVPADPEASLRYARIGFVAAAVLVLLLVWVMQSKERTIGHGG